MRSLSASVKGNRNRNINTFGSTALKKARQSLDKFIFQKNVELFNRLQHRINTEYVKAKTKNDFYKRDIKLNTAYQLVKEEKRMKRIDTQLKNYEKFQNHTYLYYEENKKREEKIDKYKKDYKIKEKKIKIILANELIKKFQNNKEYPKDYIMTRLNEIKRRNILRKKKLQNKLWQKDIYLIEYKEMKEKNCEIKRIELENMIKLRNFRINRLLTEESKQREEKRKEIEKRNNYIDKYILLKEKINEQKRNINDKYSLKYEMYSGRIDKILYKKDLNKKTINQIKFMSSNEQALIGLGQNLF